MLSTTGLSCCSALPEPELAAAAAAPTRLTPGASRYLARGPSINKKSKRVDARTNGLCFYALCPSIFLASNASGARYAA